MRKALFIITLILVAATSVSLWFTQTQEKPIPQPGTEITVQTEPKPDIGGAFILTDTEGKQVTDENFHGHVMLVYFGFTHCPDTCPVAVGTVSKAVALLGDKGDQVVPVFVTVDPERDTPSVLKGFLANFDKRFVGLTGPLDQVRKMAESYKIYFAKADKPMTDDQFDYMVDHSSVVFVMGKDGKYITSFPSNTSEKEMADIIKPYLG